MSKFPQKLHRIGASILGLFIISHLAVHLTALAGAQTHDTALSFVQLIYRNPLGETILVAFIGMQVWAGVKLLRLRGLALHRQGWAKVQVWSGLYLAFFLVIHSGAALYTHHIFGLETDFYWAAGSLHFDPIRYGFAIYYFLAVLAFFSHLGAAVYFGLPEKYTSTAKALPIAGGLIASLIILVFSGAFFAIDIPAETSAYYEQNFDWIGIGK